MNEMDHATKAAVAQLAAELGALLRGELEQNMEAFKKNMSETAAAIGDAQKGLSGAADGLFEKLDGRIKSFESNSNDVSFSLKETTIALGKEIKDSVGFLSATSHAHSQELDAISSEMSELFKNLKSKLTAAFDEQIVVRDEKILNELTEIRKIISELAKKREEDGRSFAKRLLYLTVAVGVMGLALVLAFVFLL